MTKAYHSLITYSYGDWEQYLERLALYEIFKDVIHEYKDKDTITCVIRYILWCYSYESEMVMLGSDWKKNKTDIFEKAQVLPRKNLYEDLVLLKNDKVLNSINRWLDYQDKDSWTQLNVLKDLRVEMQISCLTGILAPSGEINYDQKFKNAKYANELKLMIRDLENELIQNNPKFKEGVKEVKSAIKKNNTMGIETFSQ